ncbi:MAG: hypothetical protein HY674_22810 [Chloroflexi bacterium]|nr:hypothetical protein [Chloroflexota bacterium]
MRPSPTSSPCPRHIPLGPLLAGFCVCALLGCGQKAEAPAAQTAGAPAPGKKQTDAADAQSKADAPTNVVTIPKSVFVSDPAVAKDPFYPNSQIRAAEAAAAKPGKTEPVAFNLTAAFTLINIVGSERDRVALVNDAILEAGKPAEITVTQGDRTEKVKVRCLKITAKSVTFTVQGQAKPIELRAP